MLAFSAHHGLQVRGSELSASTVRASTMAYQQEECIYHAIRSHLPKNAWVYIDEPRADWAQRLAELSTLWAVPQLNRTSAQYAMSVASGRACHGLSLRVTRI